MKATFHILTNQSFVRTQDCSLLSLGDLLSPITSSSSRTPRIGMRESSSVKRISDKYLDKKWAKFVLSNPRLTRILKKWWRISERKVSYKTYKSCMLITLRTDLSSSRRGRTKGCRYLRVRWWKSAVSILKFYLRKR